MFFDYFEKIAQARRWLLEKEIAQMS